MEKGADSTGPVEELQAKTATRLQAFNLERDGYMVIPVASTESRKLVREAMETFQPDELEIERTDDTLLNLGGFAAWGFPSSYQHENLRVLRLEFYEQLLPILELVVGKTAFHDALSDPHVQLMQDRYLYRKCGQRPGEEGWHRDKFDLRARNKPEKEKAMAEMRPVHLLKRDDTFDLLLGGGINLNETPQFWSLAPTTHLLRQQKLHSTVDGGFYQISKTEHPTFDALRTRVMVPPGYAIVIDQTIAHQVSRGPTKEEQQEYGVPDVTHRLFTAARVTNVRTEPLIDYTDVWEDGVAPMLPSYQQPAMYSSNHRSAFLHKPFLSNGKGSAVIDGLTGWSKQWKPSLLKKCTTNTRVTDLKTVLPNLPANFERVLSEIPKFGLKHPEGLNSCTGLLHEWSEVCPNPALRYVSGAWKGKKNSKFEYIWTITKDTTEFIMKYAANSESHTFTIEKTSTYKILPRHCPSLRDGGLVGAIKHWTQDEKDLYTPLPIQKAIDLCAVATVHHSNEAGLAWWCVKDCGFGHNNRDEVVAHEANC